MSIKFFCFVTIFSALFLTSCGQSNSQARKKKIDNNKIIPSIVQIAEPPQYIFALKKLTEHATQNELLQCNLQDKQCHEFGLQFYPFDNSDFQNSRIVSLDQNSFAYISSRQAVYKCFIQKKSCTRVDLGYFNVEFINDVAMTKSHLFVTIERREGKQLNNELWKCNLNGEKCSFFNYDNHGQKKALYLSSTSEHLFVNSFNYNILMCSHEGDNCKVFKTQRNEDFFAHTLATSASDRFLYIYKALNNLKESIWKCPIEFDPLTRCKKLKLNAKSIIHKASNESLYFFNGSGKELFRYNETLLDSESFLTQEQVKQMGLDLKRGFFLLRLKNQ